MTICFLKPQVERLLDQSKKAYVQLSHRDQQYHAKMRRSEMDYQKLQKNLQSAMKTKDRKLKSGIDMSEKALKQFKMMRAKEG